MEKLKEKKRANLERNRRVAVCVHELYKQCSKVSFIGFLLQKLNRRNQCNQLFADIDDHEKIFDDNRYHSPEPELVDDWRSPKVNINFMFVKVKITIYAS